MVCSITLGLYIRLEEKNSPLTRVGASFKGTETKVLYWLLFFTVVKNYLTSNLEELRFVWLAVSKGSVHHDKKAPWLLGLPAQFFKVLAAQQVDNSEIMKSHLQWPNSCLLDSVFQWLSNQRVVPSPHRATSCRQGVQTWTCGNTSRSNSHKCSKNLLAC